MFMVTILNHLTLVTGKEGSTVNSGGSSSGKHDSSHMIVAFGNDTGNPGYDSGRCSDCGFSVVTMRVAGIRQRTICHRQDPHMQSQGSRLHQPQLKLAVSRFSRLVSVFKPASCHAVVII